MHSMAAAERSRQVQTGIQLVVDALLGAVADKGLQAPDWADLLSAAYTARNRLDHALTLAVGAFDDRVQESHDEIMTLGLEPASWLAHTLKISSSTAYAQLRVARHLPFLDSTAKAFARGEVSAQHVSVISRAVESVERGGGDVVSAEILMLQDAAEHDPRTLHRRGLSLLHRMAPDEMEAQEERRQRIRYLHLRELFDGGYEVEGYLDPIAGATVRTALDGVMGPRQQGDDRTPGQRRADGLRDLATRVLDSGQLPVRGGQRPHLLVTATLETLKADPGAPAALLEWGFPISAKALREIASDADLTPILMSAGGDPLHVGRRYRTATPKMRKALAVRDRRCVWEGCRRPPTWTQKHHLDAWVRGGRTDVERMTQVCTKHHTKLNQGWRLERLPNGRMKVHPPGSKSSSPQQSGAGPPDG